MLTGESAATGDIQLPYGTAAVVGAGLMGRRLAGVLAGGGLAVTLTDACPEVLEEAVAAATAVAVDQAAARSQSVGTVRGVADLQEAVRGADLVTEAIVEDLEVKQALFADLARFAPDAVLASNSSVIPISLIAEHLEKADRIVGTHWWNPPDLIPIVEVIQGVRTTTQTVEDVMSFMHALGKVPVHVRRDVPGFVGNRMQHALWREALALVSEGVADAETVDLVVRNTIGLRLAQMGPIENADYVGLDLTHSIHAAVLPSLSRATEPDPELTRLVAAGDLGAKTGQGYLTWGPGVREETATALATHVSRELSTQRNISQQETQ